MIAKFFLKIMGLLGYRKGQGVGGVGIKLVQESCNVHTTQQISEGFSQHYRYRCWEILCFVVTAIRKKTYYAVLGWVGLKSILFKSD
jgi:hypothetical protein